MCDEQLVSPIDFECDTRGNWVLSASHETEMPVEIYGNMDVNVFSLVFIHAVRKYFDLDRPHDQHFGL